jgi:hypothetical protein
MSLLGMGRLGGLWFEARLGKKLARPISTTSQAWWYGPIIVAIQEA